MYMYDVCVYMHKYVFVYVGVCLCVELGAQPLLSFLVLLFTLFETGSVIGWSSPVSASLPGQQTPGIHLTPASPSLGLKHGEPLLAAFRGLGDQTLIFPMFARQSVLPTEASILLCL